MGDLVQIFFSGNCRQGVAAADYFRRPAVFGNRIIDKIGAIFERRVFKITDGPIPDNRPRLGDNISKTRLGLRTDVKNRFSFGHLAYFYRFHLPKIFIGDDGVDGKLQNRPIFFGQG